jgi:hypothetical protein
LVAGGFVYNFFNWSVVGFVFDKDDSLLGLWILMTESFPVASLIPSGTCLFFLFPLFFSSIVDRDFG